MWLMLVGILDLIRIHVLNRVIGAEVDHAELADAASRCGAVQLSSHPSFEAAPALEATKRTTGTQHLRAGCSRRRGDTA
jgi:hypothetical protein